MDFKVGDYVYASWCCGIITEIGNDGATVEFETEHGGGSALFDFSELEHARNFRNNFSYMCYRLYVADWENSHNIGMKEKSESIKKYYEHLEELGVSDSYFPYEDYILEFGYNGEIYANFSEFCEAEYRNHEYIRNLLDDDELFDQYEDDISRR